MKFKRMTFDRIKKLQLGDILHHNINKNADGTCQRRRVNGKVKLWKTRPLDYRVPLKHGLRSYDYLTPDVVDILHHEDDCPFCKDESE